MNWLACCKTQILMLSPVVSADDMVAGVPTPMAVCSNCCECVLPITGSSLCRQLFTHIHSLLWSVTQSTLKNSKAISALHADNTAPHAATF